MRMIKALAIIGLAVALVAVPALAQQPTVPVTVKCENNKITIDKNPVRLVIAAKDIARWTFEASVGDCKVKVGDKEDTLKNHGLNKIEIAVEVRDLIKLDPNPVAWPQPGFITGTPLKAGTTKYSIKFLKDSTVLHEVKEASALEIIVATPTLTEWGLIALSVLLAGGMGYMLYRRRPALRPAAP